MKHSPHIITTHNFFGLPQIPADFENLITTIPGTKNQYIKKALAYDRDELKLFASNCFESFNPGQKYAYETIVNALLDVNLFFIDGPGNKLI